MSKKTNILCFCWVKQNVIIIVFYECTRKGLLFTNLECIISCVMDV